MLLAGINHVAVLTKDDTLQPDPVGEGVFVGVDNYYPDPFP